MSDLVTRQPGGMASWTPESFSRSEGKALTKAQNAEVARGLVAGVRVQAAGFVAGMALQTTSMLSREAAFQAAGDERTAARLEHIVDAFTMFAASEVNRFRY